MKHLNLIVYIDRHTPFAIVVVSTTKNSSSDYKNIILSIATADIAIRRRKNTLLSKTYLANHLYNFKNCHLDFLNWWLLCRNFMNHDVCKTFINFYLGLGNMSSSYVLSNF